MAKTFTPAPDDVRKMAEEVIEQYHPDIKESGLTIDYLFVKSDSGHALTLRGVPCFAIAKKITTKDRVKGCADCEITIDDDKWQDLTDLRRRALLDHELYHFRLDRDAEEGNEEGFKLDSAGRPVVSIRPHDWEFGWFEEVAKRWGQDSNEVVQAKLMYDKAGNALFPFLADEAQPGLALLPPPPKVPNAA